MTLSLSEIIDVDKADVARPTQALALLHVEPSRRSVMKMLTMASLALGGTVLSWRPQGLLTPAAAVGTETAPGGAHTGWLECMVDYDPDPDTGGAYYGWNPACNNAQNYISSTYCRSSGWHRYDTEYPVSGVTVDYKIVDNRCWGSGQSFASRNAWRWRPPGGNEYRCSDGQMVVTDSSGTHTYNTVCRWKTAN